MKKQKNKKKKPILFFLLFFIVIGWFSLLYFFGVKKIIEISRINNPYIFIFFVALIAGASMFTTSTFYVTLASLSLLGYDPYLLGFSSGIGIVLGDTFFYYFGHEASNIKWLTKTKLYKKLKKFIIKQPKIIVQIIVFLYAVISPFPNDIIMMTLGATEYKYKDFIFGLFLGDVFFMTFVSLLPTYFI